MQVLSEDDLNLREMTDKELDAAWDLWFDLAQATSDYDPEYTRVELHSYTIHSGPGNSHDNPPRRRSRQFCQLWPSRASR